jgi:ADP-L-glycero-D-manno-heptose 6-epimerase
MIIITGGAGLIGSALLWALNEQGRSDVLLVDELEREAKERNIGHLLYEELVGIKEFREKLLAGEYEGKGVEAILHMGACSSTTENNWEYLRENNVEYSQEIIRWCFDRDIRCVYASSGAVYGSGGEGYSDNHDLFDELTPLNLYGKSKLEVDKWARDGGYLDKVVGLRYFNVFGPNEAHKEHMRSVVAKAWPRLRDEGVMELFKSHNPDWQDGEFTRDFLYIKDAVKMTLFFLENKAAAGVFNCGTGRARSWNAVARAMFAAAGKPENISYIDMPENLRKQYQYETEADISKLKAIGCGEKAWSLEEAVEDYIQGYLQPDKHLGE